MAVTRIVRLGLSVRDLGAMTRFYATAFGCIPNQTGTATTRLALGAQIIELSAATPPGAPWPAAPESNDLTFQHFAIAVSDIRAAHLHLTPLSGWTPITASGPVKLLPSSGGVTAMKFRDPEGHPLELIEFPDRPSQASLFYGIDHSAIVVRDTARSLAFYAALGLAPGQSTRNRGAEQARLDHLHDPDVTVTPLYPPGAAPPHLELLCYAEPPTGGAPPDDKSPADAIATRLTFAASNPKATLHDAVAAGGTLIGGNLLRDPDGHDLVIEGADWI